VNLPHPKFCVLPWISLEASPVGTVRPCCLARDEIVDDAGVKCRLDTHDFDTIRNSQHMQALRQAFLDNTQPETCDRCWSEEHAGRTSKRMHTLERLKHLDLDTAWTTQAKALQFVDLKLGNICNLKCRICGSWSSSTFAVEEIAHETTPPGSVSFHRDLLRAGAWPRRSPEFWKQLDAHAAAIEYVEFTGGEPFMIQEHFDLLQRWVDQGHAGHIDIHYNTNGTVWPHEREHLWSQFRGVEIAFSIDDVGARFEYQRTGADWSEVQINLECFRQLRRRNPGIKLQICATVNVFNILYLADLAAWIPQQRFDFVYWNMLHDTPELSIATLSPAVKQHIQAHYDSNPVPEWFAPELAQILRFMWAGTRDLGTQLRTTVQRLDQRREQQLRAVAPELAALLDL